MTKNPSSFERALSGEEPHTDDDWSIHLGFLIHDCARLRRIVLDEQYKPLYITGSQAWLMTYLSREEGLPQSTLAKRMGLGKVALGGLIDRLEGNGLIERHADLHDRRVNNIYLTSKGRDAITRLQQLTLQANRKMLQKISPDDIKTTVNTLKKLKLNLRDLKSSSST